MSAVLQPYDRELRLIANDLFDKTRAKREGKQSDPTPMGPPPRQPLCRVQEYLVQLKVCTELLTACLKEFKELIFIVSIISFFAWGVVDLIIKLHVHPF